MLDILIIADTMGLDMKIKMTSCFHRFQHYKKVVTPSIWTVPSITSILTGILPSEHGIAKEIDIALPKDRTFLTLPEVLSEVYGVKTYAIVNNPLISRENGYDTFDYFLNIPEILKGPESPSDFLEGFLKSKDGRNRFGEIPVKEENKELLIQEIKRLVFSTIKDKQVFRELEDYIKRTFEPYRNVMVCSWPYDRLALRLLAKVLIPYYTEVRPKEKAFVFVLLMAPHLYYTPKVFENQDKSSLEIFIEQHPISNYKKNPPWILFPREERKLKVLRRIVARDLDRLLEEELFSKCPRAFYPYYRQKQTRVIFTSDHGEGLGQCGFNYEHSTIFNNEFLSLVPFWTNYRVFYLEVKNLFQLYYAFFLKGRELSRKLEERREFEFFSEVYDQGLTSVANIRGCNHSSCYYYTRLQ